MTKVKHKGNLPPTFCKDKRPCFARDGNHKCTILDKSYDLEDMPCPFCKRKRDD